MKTARTTNTPLIFTTYDIGRMTGTDPTTVHKWIDKGLLRGYRTPGGHRRVRGEDLRAFLSAHKMPVPRELGGSDAVRVMLVDEDSDAVKALSRALKRIKPNWDVLTASGGVDALLMVAGNPPDALVFDIAMREVDGFAIARHLLDRSDTSSVKMIGMCSRSSADLERKASAAGIGTLLKKPVSGQDLAEAVESATGIRPAA